MQFIISVHCHGGNRKECCCNCVQRQCQTGGIVVTGADNTRTEALLFTCAKEFRIWLWEARFIQQTQRKIFQVRNVDCAFCRAGVKRLMDYKAERIIWQCHMNKISAFYDTVTQKQDIDRSVAQLGLQFADSSVEHGKGAGRVLLQKYAHFLCDNRKR